VVSTAAALASPALVAYTAAMMSNATAVDASGSHLWLKGK
jgi:hypothetical protein